MAVLDIVAKAATLALSYPWERHMRNHHEATDEDYNRLRDKLMTSMKPVHEAMPKRDEALKAMQNCKIIGNRGDGNVLAKCNGKDFLVTKDGLVFEHRQLETQSPAPETKCSVCEAAKKHITEENPDKPPQITPRDTADLVRMEREGDYCLSCVPSKHLMRSSDAMKDAINVVNSKNAFTDVAEEKIQNAVYELNAAEKDLEMARVPEAIKPAVAEFRNQVRRLRNFLRQDQSGLEIATVVNQPIDTMKKNLETAYEVNNVLVKYGYDLAKLQLQERAKAALQEA
jgi:hypothetical protein